MCGGRSGEWFMDRLNRAIGAPKGFLSRGVPDQIAFGGINSGRINCRLPS